MPFANTNILAPSASNAIDPNNIPGTAGANKFIASASPPIATAPLTRLLQSTSLNILNPYALNDTAAPNTATTPAPINI